MARTTLCAITAATLALASIGLMATRQYCLGNEVNAPSGADTWKIVMVGRGRSTADDARVQTSLPQDFRHQHILRETFRSKELSTRLPDAKSGDRRHLQWSARPGKPPSPFQVHHEFVVCIDGHLGAAATSVESVRYAPPQVGECLDTGFVSGTDMQRIALQARNLVSGRGPISDQMEAVFRYVDEQVATEPCVNGAPIGASSCMENGSGDARAKSRLLVALLRSQGVPARMVFGLALNKGHEQLAHYWVEAWLAQRWFPMCTVYHLFGRVPATFLVFGFGDMSMVRGRNVSDLDYAFLVEKVPDAAIGADPSFIRRTLRAMSFHALPPTEQHLVEFLLLLPIAALIVCVYRNVIGLHGFGTFAPALIGLVFRDLGSWMGLVVFVSIVLVGWVMRRVLDRYHLLQVPRQALLLSLVVVVLIAGLFVANSRSGSMTTTPYISLFPLIILTGMIERFWTLETEDGMAASFRALATTVLIALTISVILHIRALTRFAFRFPESIGVIMACQLLLGRYTGYRISELARFREFLRRSANGRTSYGVPPT